MQPASSAACAWISGWHEFIYWSDQLLFIWIGEYQLSFSSFPLCRYSSILVLLYQLSVSVNSLFLPSGLLMSSPPHFVSPLSDPRPFFYRSLDSRWPLTAPFSIFTLAPAIHISFPQISFIPPHLHVLPAVIFVTFRQSHLSHYLKEGIALHAGSREQRSHWCRDSHKWKAGFSLMCCL